MLIAQITDTHLKAGRALAYGLVDTAALLEALVDHVNALRPAVDAVLVTGDLTDRGQPGEYAALRVILDRLAMPWFVVPGNHDERRNLLAAFADHAYLAGCAEFVHYVIDDFPLRLIGLDTTIPGKPHGFLCQARLDWLEARLAKAPDEPTLLFLHHPPFLTGIRHMDVQNLLNGADLLALAARHRQVRHIACGHVHRAIETTRAGIGVSIAPNGAHSVTLDLDPDGPSSFTMEPPSIRLFRFGDDREVVSHLGFVGRFDGPHPFFAADGSLID